MKNERKTCWACVQIVVNALFDNSPTNIAFKYDIIVLSGYDCDQKCRINPWRIWKGFREWGIYHKREKGEWEEGNRARKMATSRIEKEYSGFCISLVCLLHRNKYVFVRKNRRGGRGGNGKKWENVKVQQLLYASTRNDSGRIFEIVKKSFKQE